MYRKLASLLILSLAAGVADAQCTGQTCSLASSVRSKTKTVVRSTTVVNASVCAPAPVQAAPPTACANSASSTSQVIEARQTRRSRR